MPVLYPDACNAFAILWTTDPLPFVPVTWMVVICPAGLPNFWLKTIMFSSPIFTLKFRFLEYRTFSNSTLTLQCRRYRYILNSFRHYDKLPLCSSIRFVEVSTKQATFQMKRPSFLKQTRHCANGELRRRTHSPFEFGLIGRLPGCGVSIKYWGSMSGKSGAAENSEGGSSNSIICC